MDEKLKVIIIGCGRVSVKHLKAIETLKNLLTLKAVVDTNEDAAKKLIGGRKDIKIYNDYTKAIDEIKPDIVAVTVPSGLHFRIADYAMDKGSNLLLEKPMTMNLSEAKSMWKKSTESGKKIAMGHIYRYLPLVSLIQRDISMGVYGKVTHGSIYVRWGHDNETYYDTAKWRGTWKSDGGALMNQSIHAIDLLLWLMGSEPARCQAMLARRVRRIEAEDTGLANIELENGALAQIEGTTATDPNDHRAAFSIFTEKAQFNISLIRGKPKLEIRDYKGKKLNSRYIRRQFKEGGLFSFKCALNPHLGIYKDLVLSIKNNKQPIADAYSGLSSIDTLMGIYKSAKENRTVELPLKEDFGTEEMIGFFD
ncbi:MAG: Gfo/Idh/MocA family oxidoreductase [Clostridiales bacterium]|nr:Gfo/Idh/MocA family oxidoreductase [Clostridiales bacterium]